MSTTLLSPRGRKTSGRRPELRREGGAVAALDSRGVRRFGDRLVVANSLGKDSCVVWDLAKRVSPKIRGFIVTTRFKPRETKRFMRAEWPAIRSCRVFRTTSRSPTGFTRPIPTAAATC